MTQLQPFYTTYEMSIILNRHMAATRRIIAKLNVPKSKAGRTVVYYICDIRSYAPKLYDSMQEVILNNPAEPIDFEPSISDEDIDYLQITE